MMKWLTGSALSREPARGLVSAYMRAELGDEAQVTFEVRAGSRHVEARLRARQRHRRMPVTKSCST